MVMEHQHNPRRRRDDAVDPALESLLDEALAVPEAPAGLSERVMAATRHRLPRRRGVLARIGLTPVWQVAATVALAGLVGWALVTALSPAEPGQQPGMTAHEGPAPATRQIALSDAEQRELLAAFTAAEGVNFEAIWLQRRQSVGEERADDEMWADTDDPVELLLDTYEVEWLGAEGPGVLF